MSGSRARLARQVVFGALRGHRRDVALLAIWSAAEALPALVFGRAVAGAIDAFRSGASGLGVAWLGALLAASVAGAAGSRQSFARLAAIVEPLRDRLVTAVVTAALHRPLSQAREPDTAAVARITHQTEIVRDSFAGLITTVRTSAFTAGAALLGLVTLAPLIAPFVIVPLAVSLLLFAGLIRALADRQRTYVLTEEAVTTEVSAAVTSLRDISASRAAERVGWQIARQVGAQARAARALAGVTAARTLVLAVGCWVPVLLVIAAAPWLLHHGVTVGAVIGALAYLTSGLQLAMSTLVQGTASSGVRMAVTLERILAGTTADGSSATAGPGRAGPAVRAPAGNTLRLRNVTFAYGPHADPVVRDLCLDVPDGDHLAVVGPSGIGKSTLAGLMTGMLRPDRGRILLGGVPAGELPPAVLASTRVLIPQEAYVFTGTVTDNLTYLNPHASAEAVRAAITAVGAAALVERVGGCQAVLEPGILSEGERQLIALARAYLSPARLVVLDEATCHLDPAAEAQAEEAFARRPGSLVVIAHRATSAMRARRILVLDGTGAQLGDHWSLLTESALYADLIGHWTAPGAASEVRPPARLVSQPERDPRPARPVRQPERDPPPARPPVSYPP